MSTSFTRILLIAGAAGLLATAYTRTQTTSLMTTSATAFLNSLTDDQKKKVQFDFANEERFFWHFVPGNNIQQTYKRPRLGLTLGEMQPYQQHLASSLLAAGLSSAGYMKAKSIMSLEDILRILEKDTVGRRDPLKYHFSVFGAPSDSGAWSFRVEGHHLSQHFVVHKGKIAATPSFFGTNPAEVKEGPRAGLRVLGREEDLGRSLYQSLTEAQKKTALVSAEAYKDILTEASRKASLANQPNGLSSAKMTAKQRETLNAIVEEYASNMPQEVYQARMAKLKAAGTNINFAWAGGPNRGDPHYYRIVAPTFLIEYDNTQNGANHVHSVWREFTGDFGEDLLKEHYERSHSGAR